MDPIVTSHIREKAVAVAENNVYESTLQTPIRRRREAITLEHFTGKHPPWITDDNMMFRTTSLSQIRGYAEQVMRHGDWLWYNPTEKGALAKVTGFAYTWLDNKTVYQIDNMIRSWYYRDCTSRSMYDTQISTLPFDLTVPFTPFPASTYWSAVGIRSDPKTGLDFPGGPSYLRLFVRWRQNVLHGRFDDSIYDNGALLHFPKVSSRSFKPLELHSTGRPMAYMPSASTSIIYITTAGGPYAFGWYYPRHETMPNVSSTTSSSQLPGYRPVLWNTTELNAWKIAMASVTGYPNPYYVKKANRGLVHSFCEPDPGICTTISTEHWTGHHPETTSDDTMFDSSNQFRGWIEQMQALGYYSNIPSPPSVLDSIGVFDDQLAWRYRDNPQRSMYDAVALNHYATGGTFVGSDALVAPNNIKIGRAHV